MAAVLTCTELKEILTTGVVVIDVMTPEDYEMRHLTGAKNACIYEMVFLDRIAEQVPDRNTRMVVYDATGTSRAAELARERLVQAGYANVSVLKGGLSAWCSAGLPVEGLVAVAEPTLRDNTYRIDEEKSALEWIGRNLGKRHLGRIAIQGGELVIRGGRPVEGRIVVDMTTITNQDLEDRVWREMLIRHLESDDFFAVAQFPTALFQLTGWEKLDGGSLEAPNGVAIGNLTIKDVTRQISFPAIVAPQVDGSIKAHAIFDFDRTLWNVCYGSGKLFERLGMHLVHDMISLELFVLAY